MHACMYCYMCAAGMDARAILSSPTELSAFTFGVRSGLAGALGLALERVLVTGVRAGSLVVDVTLLFEPPDADGGVPAPEAISSSVQEVGLGCAHGRAWSVWMPQTHPS